MRVECDLLWTVNNVCINLSNRTWYILGLIVIIVMTGLEFPIVKMAITE